MSELGFDEALAREVSRYMDGPGWDDEQDESQTLEVSREEAAERRAEHQAEERGGWW